MSENTRIALVTGASRGIGRAVALELARRHWRVIALARSQKALEKLDDEIKAFGGEASLVPHDLRDFDALDRLGGALFERFGRLDGLAACAGALGALTPAHQATPSMMDEVTGVNFTANWRLIRALHPLLRASDAGRAVFLSSGATTNPRAYWGPYAAAKAALNTLVQCYAAELNVTPIKANLFNPGPTRTSMRAKAYPGEDPMTLPTPEDIAPAIADMLAPTYNENGAWVEWRRSSVI
jgi:NAD(P)-dependent dehydrogenase (short-subunit alcohol dehydrogenase family)